mgnify:CR=1 FL=1
MDLLVSQALDMHALQARLGQLWEQTGDPVLLRLARGRHPYQETALADDREYLDWVSTALMDTYRQGGEAAVFALLFELNKEWFLQAIQSRLRRVGGRVDAQDVLQEVFLNIYRYPHRFHPDRADAFRGWGHRIARNTLLKFLKGQSRLAQFCEMDDEEVLPEDVRYRRPDRAAIDAESAVVVNQAYLLYLQLYLVHFAQLAARERLALTLVEVEGVSYRDAADSLGIRLENLKMVIFRGRRKILRGMAKSLAVFDEAGLAGETTPTGGRSAAAKCPKLVDRAKSSAERGDLDASCH